MAFTWQCDLYAKTRMSGIAVPNMYLLSPIAECCDPSKRPNMGSFAGSVGESDACRKALGP